MPKTLFISYSHQDENQKDLVVGHLKVAERQGVFDVWDDRRIEGGGDWLADIDTALNKADIAVLLISRHFLTSDFIMDHEVKTILKRHAEHDVIIYPILISDCTWQSVDWLKAINIRPTDGVPLHSFTEAKRDQFMAEIASEISALLHPDDEQASVAPSAPSRDQPSLPSGGILNWWRTTSVATRATVVGTVVFAGLALVWSVMLGSIAGDQINAECGAVITGNFKDGQLNVDC